MTGELDKSKILNFNVLKKKKKKKLLFGLKVRNNIFCQFY